MTTLEQEHAQADTFRAPRMVHFEHPERIGEAFCGSNVIGVRGRFGPVECVVCIHLMREHRRAERERRR